MSLREALYVGLCLLMAPLCHSEGAAGDRGVGCQPEGPGGYLGGSGPLLGAGAALLGAAVCASLYRGRLAARLAVVERERDQLRAGLGAAASQERPQARPRPQDQARRCRELATKLREADKALASLREEVEGGRKAREEVEGGRRARVALARQVARLREENCVTRARCDEASRRADQSEDTARSLARDKQLLSRRAAETATELERVRRELESRRRRPTGRSVGTQVEPLEQFARSLHQLDRGMELNQQAREQQPLQQLFHKQEREPDTAVLCLDSECSVCTTVNCPLVHESCSDLDCLAACSSCSLPLELSQSIESREDLSPLTDSKPGLATIFGNGPIGEGGPWNLPGSVLACQGSVGRVGDSPSAENLRGPDPPALLPDNTKKRLSRFTANEDGERRSAGDSPAFRQFLAELSSLVGPESPPPELQVMQVGVAEEGEAGPTPDSEGSPEPPTNPSDTPRFTESTLYFVNDETEPIF